MDTIHYVYSDLKTELKDGRVVIDSEYNFVLLEKI